MNKHKINAFFACNNKFTPTQNWLACHGVTECTKRVSIKNISPENLHPTYQCLQKVVAYAPWESKVYTDFYAPCKFNNSRFSVIKPGMNMAFQSNILISYAH